MTRQDDEVRRRLIRTLDTFTCGVLASSDNKVVFANEKLAEMLGHKRESLWGYSILDLVPGELRQNLADETELVRAGDLRARLTALLRRDGTSMPVLILPMTEIEIPTDTPARFDVIIDLGAVMTAKHSSYEDPQQLRGSLSRIAFELQTASLLAGGSPAAQPDLQHPELEELSKREREVLARLVEGDRVQGIAEKLFISQHTVRNHLKSMFRKLGVSSQGELIERMREIR